MRSCKIFYEVPAGGPVCTYPGFTTLGNLMRGSEKKCTSSDAIRYIDVPAGCRVQNSKPEAWTGDTRKSERSGGRITAHTMEAGRDKLLRRFTIVATTVTAAILLTADYGPQPHALSPVSRWLDAGKNWLLKPTEKELAELEKRGQAYLARKGSEEKDGDRN